MPHDSLEMIPPVEEGIFTPPPYDHAPPALMGGFCATCGRYAFPRRTYCSGCLGPMEESILGSEGTVYSFTVVRTKPPLGLPQPYGVGYIDLAGVGLRVFCLLDPRRLDEMRIDLPVRLAVGSLGHNGRGEPRLRPYYTPRGGV